MIRFSNKKNILWDFDGVLIDSQEIRIRGFRETLAEYPLNQVEELLDFHRINGGLSRYVKFQYFFDYIRNEKLTIEKMEELSNRFSRIMRDSLPNKKFLIQDSLTFVISNFRSYHMHIISGSDAEELRYLCELLGLKKYFISIEGSPTPKIDLVERVLSKYSYKPSETIFIGDAINDYQAAEINKIDFYGYNNPELVKYGSGYINSFQ